MMMYERRIESSMYKTMNELKKLQKARKAEEARAAKEQSAEESPPARRGKGDLKKQTQFASERIGAKLSVIKAYDDTTPAETGENKANQSQFEGSPDRAGRRKGARQALGGSEVAG